MPTQGQSRHRSDEGVPMSDLVEYPAGGEFPVVIGRTVQESSPAWPVTPRAKDGAPNDFEMFGHRAIYHDGWRAVCPWPAPNFTEAAKLGRTLGDPITPEVLEQLDREGWELYDIGHDPTESRDVAAEHPDRLRDLIALWWEEAEKYKVLPLDGSLQARLQ